MAPTEWLRSVPSTCAGTAGSTGESEIICVDKLNTSKSFMMTGDGGVKGYGN